MEFSKPETLPDPLQRSMPVSLADIPTPALLLDSQRLQRNCTRMAERMERFGVHLRPHMKTAKSVPVAECALAEQQFRGITVSTLNEAAWFARQGFSDLLYAVGFTLDRLPRAFAVQDYGAKLGLLTDHPEIAAQLGAALQRHQRQFPVYIEIDCGHGRGGVLPESAALLDIARQLDRCSHTVLAGVLTHAGQSYECSSVAEIAAVAEQERLAVVTAAGRLRAAGLPCATVSAGSTPTATHAVSMQGLTEMRPGVYQFGDLAQVCLGSCRIGDLALSVLSTVMGHNHSSNNILIDAGGLALSKDTSSSHYRDDWGYGLVCDLEGRLLEPKLSIDRLEQEHGMISTAGRGTLFTQLPVGSRIRVLPNHACMTAAAYPGYWLTAGTGLSSSAFWPRCNGW